MEDFWPMSHFLQQINVKISVLFKYHQKFGQKIVAVRFKSPNLVTLESVGSRIGLVIFNVELLCWVIDKRKCLAQIDLNCGLAMNEIFEFFTWKIFRITWNHYVLIDLYAFIISTKCTPTITHSPFDGNIYLLYRFTKQF